jgi:hypothetical protein
MCVLLRGFALIQLPDLKIRKDKKKKDTKESMNTENVYGS